MFSFILLIFDLVLQREEFEASLAEAHASFEREHSQWAGERASLATEVNFNFFYCILIINLFVVNY